MPKRSFHTLLWSAEHQRYELSTGGHFQRCFPPHDEQSWLDWLGEQTSFAFHGQQGHLSVVKEERARGGGYWYAYSTQSEGPRKHYLGPTLKVTLARLEEEAGPRETLSPLLPLQNEVQAIAGAAQRDGASERATASVLPSPFTTSVQHMTLPVLASKLSPPRLPTTLVERASLQTRLEEALALPLTLLSASGGWGKTTLLSAWAQRSSHRIAWLSLDEMENIPVRFWNAVIAALRTCHADIGATTLALLSSPQPMPLSLTLTSLLNEVASLDGTTVLLLDDYHLIADAAIHESLWYVLEHLPTNLRLVLSTRIDPPLPLARLRMRGQLSEIRDLDLRFRADDARHFLVQRMELPLSETEVGILESRTEGWIAGLQLAALAMRQREDHAAFVQTFGGSHRYVLDYFQDDILTHLPPAAQDFLLQTAILSRLHAPLCQAVTGEMASQELLEELERENLFLVSLDEERRWYRFHELFRQTLLTRLRARQPELLPVLHQRAARWYEAHHQLQEAIAHLLSAADFSSAAHLMERTAEQMWLVGDAQTVHRWIKALPDPVLLTHGRLALNAAKHLQESIFWGIEGFQAQIQTQIEQTMERMDALLRRQQERTAVPETEEALPATEVSLLQRRLTLLRGWIAAREATWQGKRERLPLLIKALEELAEQEETTWKMIPLSLTFMEYEVLQRDGALLVPMLQKMKQQVSLVDNDVVAITVMRWLAVAYTRAGKLHLAQRECQAALKLIERAGVQTLETGYLHYWLGEISYAWNRLEEATRFIQQALQIAHIWQQPNLLVAGSLLAVRVKLSAGDLHTAQQIMQQVDHLAESQRFVFFQSWVAAAWAEYWLAAGDVVAANDWAAQTTFDPQEWDPNLKWALLSLVRVYLAQRDYHQVIETLESFQVHLDRPGDMGTALDFLALQVAALEGLGERKQARGLVARLLRLTEPEGALRVYLDAGEPMRQALLDFHADPHDEEVTLPAVSSSYVSLLLAAFEQEEHKRTVRAVASVVGTEEALLAPVQNTSSAHPGLFEPLSPQEQRVLRLLIAGHTYAEMARELIVSSNTIKTQVSSIYRKLGVNRRAEASLVAQQLHLF